MTPQLIAQVISRTNWQNRVLFLGNSLPIRDMDQYAEPGESIPWVAANRGASGIDGLISTACGFAEGAREPLVLVIGDMSFLYDTNGLSFVNQISVPIIIVLVNNKGNGIFKTLPIADSGPLFERYFLAPHAHNLSAASQIFGVRHETVSRIEDFELAYQTALELKYSVVIEVIC